MTTTQIPDSIRASIHQDAINRVSEFFNATTMDIMNELLQNSRRSGATAVEITTGDDLITVADNGHGIKDPAALLAFGLTEWDQAGALAEHPAGMGLYSLARCENVRISSKTQDGAPWRVDLTPEHFVGKLEAPVNALPEDPDDPHAQGTTVTFSCGEKGPDHTGWRHLPHHAENILEAARHYPLPILLNGQEAPRKDFLAGAGYTEEWEGIRIGVYPTGNHSRRVNYPGRMNFHGIIVQNPGLNSIETMGQPWSVNADVLNCPRLSLTLPARREVVETPFMEELRQVCTAAVYRAMQAHPEPVRVPFEVSAHAAALGIALPEAAPELKRWAPETANHNWSMWEEEAHGLPNQDDSIIMDLALDPPDGQALARAARQNGLTARLFKPDDRLAGYGWYDRMNRAANLGITVTGQEGRYNLGDIRDENKEPEDQRPEAIEFSLTCSNGQVISLPTDVVFYQGESDDIWNGGTPLVTRQSQVSIQELTELMMDAFFQANDDSDADSPDTQEDECRLVYEKTATALLSTPEEAVIATIKGAVERHVRYEVPQGMTATIRIKRGFLTQVTLEEGV